MWKNSWLSEKFIFASFRSEDKRFSIVSIVGEIVIFKFQMSLSLTLEIQDFEWSFATVRTYFPSLLRIFSGSLEIIEKRESCLRWRRATAGRDPKWQ